MKYVYAPWLSGQVLLLNMRQNSERFQTYTCSKCGGILEATEDGWRCPGVGEARGECTFAMNWCHDVDLEKLYPCAECGKLRTADEG